MDNTLGILFLTLLICSFLGFVILLKDDGRFCRLWSCTMSSIKNDGFFVTMRLGKNFILRKMHIQNRRTAQVKENKDGKIFIMFLFEGGYGDYLICANFFDYFRKKFLANNVFFDLYGKSILKDIFNYDIPNVTIYDKIDCNFDTAQYDVIFKIAKRNQLMHSNKDRLLQFAPKLHEYILLCEKYIEENKLIFDMNPKLDGMNTAISITQGKKRIQEADIYGFLGITEDFKYELHINEDEELYLKKRGLVSKKFILVHRGWDAAYDEGEHVKAWSLKSCGDIIPQLKKHYPDYKIVLFGVDRKQAPSSHGADLDLIGKTTLNQVKVLLKYAAVLIDNEGGMVHLRHALNGGASVVLFGPTAKECFGYSENINIRSSVCNQWCEWLYEDWQYKCAKTGKNEHPCMEAIKTDDVINAVNTLLEQQ